MKPAPGTVIGERFRLERRLDEGGMGEVWQAEHMTLGSPCAVKLLHASSLDRPGVRERFEREAQAAARLRSPYVVQILDYGVEEDTPYIAMELLEGESLLSKLKRVKRLSVEETCRWVDDVSRALDKAHKAGVIHRDLKPGNIFLEADDDGVRAKVLDFGVAKEADDRKKLTRSGTVLGTPYYMSPEQAMRPAEVDHRADLWSIAVIVYRCLTGKRPFPAKSMGDLLTMIMGEPPPVPSEQAPHLPPGFDRWFAKGVEREPARRFKSARGMAERLRRALGAGAPSRPSLPSLGAEAAHSIPLGSEDETRDVFAMGSTVSDEATLEMRRGESTVEVSADEPLDEQSSTEQIVATQPDVSSSKHGDTHWRSVVIGMVIAGGFALGYQALGRSSGMSSEVDAGAPSAASTVPGLDTAPPPIGANASVDAEVTASASVEAPAKAPKVVPRPASTFVLPPAIPFPVKPAATATASASASASAPAPEPSSKYGDYGF